MNYKPHQFGNRAFLRWEPEHNEFRLYEFDLYVFQYVLIDCGVDREGIIQRYRMLQTL